MKLLSQMFTTLRNGQLARKQIVLVPYSNFCWNILNVLLVHGYIQGIQKSNQTILIILKYINGVPAIHELKQVSRSSQRVYKPWNRLNLYQQGLGLVLVSTSKGILPSAKAFEYKIGGEVLCQVF